MCELIRVVGNAQVVLYIQFELIKMTSLLSVGGNLNDSQIQFIATQLVEMFPNESLADFKLCFQRGCIGQYGEIYRMDGIVLRKWMESYLDEKYATVEDIHRKQKEDEKKQVTPETDKDWFKVWQESIDKLPHQNRFDLTDAEINREGQEKPKPAPYPITTPEEAYVRDRHLAWITENFEPRTAQPLPSFITESEFNAKYDSEKLNGQGK